MQPPGVAQPLYSTRTQTYNICPSLIEIGSKTAEKNSAQTDRQTNRHYENNGHLAVNQYTQESTLLGIKQFRTDCQWMTNDKDLVVLDAQ